ncbi:MBL fold metallo-hydrolase [Paenibacillus sp. IB182496]|uniref:MBL fold metallo-hydrolase n=1 Tax=Paenibacillus sabuli TaxID=2772509 RepID=A0A927BTC0_9BACL|nr:MBL fold metallo-hydrolase [Paenibacillus sabuli]MBD2846417.1 MBL fold metallo-hydrolase [Paenibacillus sabuli]
MGLRFTVLASGSTGNATLVQTEDATVLVDAGLSARKLEGLMKEREVEGSQLDAVLITHEHSDHIKGLGAFARKYELPVYANEATWESMHKHLGKLDPQQRHILPTGGAAEFGGTLGRMRVQSYAISHDAAEPVGYCFYSGEAKLSLVTDLGYMSDKVKQQVMDSDVMVLESNHDPELLRMGRYPWNIKRRILSDLGHLSNEAAGDALSELVTDRLQRVYLAHLSLDHNLQDLARMTVNNILESRGFFFKRDEFALRDTHHDRATPWDEVRRR